MKDTEQLIKYSQGVICHFSGAISYAVLNHKPICFFYYKDWLQNDYIVNNTKQYTEALSTQANIIDDNFDYKKLNFYYNKKSFNKYIQKYLKCYTKKTSSYWSGIFKEIKKNEI